MRRRLQIVREPHSRARSFASIEDAIAAIRAGQMVIVVDDENRENEGDLTVAAEKITPQVINFMAQYGRGLICLAMTPEHLDALEIPQRKTDQRTSRQFSDAGDRPQSTHWINSLIRGFTRKK